MKKLYLVLFSLIFFIAQMPLLFAQQQDQEVKSLIYYIDYASFMGDADGVNSYLEVYISIPNYQLKYVPKGETFIAAYEIKLNLADKNGEFKKEKSWQGIKTIDSLKQAQNLVSLEIAAFMVPPGEYRAQLSVTDLNSGNSGDADIEVKVNKFVDSQIKISDVQFARSIKKFANQSKFVKNGIEILPNPSRAFGIESPFIYFYSEIYNIPFVRDVKETFHKQYFLIDDHGDTVKTESKEFIPRGNNGIWAGKINILDLISGKYDLVLCLYDKSNKLLATSKGDVWISNPYKVMTYKQFREEDIEEFKAQIYYIVDEKERKFFDQLDKSGKINYINNFWKNIDPDFRTEHLKRFYIAQQRFASSTLPGWKTDRGRVYIMYGPPDDIDRQPASLSTRAYEIWYYEHMKGQSLVQFVFADLGIHGNYQLIHCDLKSGDRLEIYNPNWKDDIKISR